MCCKTAVKSWKIVEKYRREIRDLSAARHSLLLYQTARLRCSQYGVFGKFEFPVHASGADETFDSFLRANSKSECDPLHLIESDLVVAPVIKPGGPCRFMARHLLGDLQLAAVLQAAAGQGRSARLPYKRQIGAYLPIQPRLSDWRLLPEPELAQH